MTVLADEQGVALQGIAVDAASVYFTTHYNTLSKASLMGGAITPLTTLLNLDVGTIAVDSQNVYLPSNSTLVSVPLAGGAPVPLTALTSSNGTVVVHGNRVYSSDSFLGGVVGVSTTGTQRIVYSTQGGSGIAVDDENVYWGTGSGVSVAPIAGGTPTTLPLPWSGITIAGMTGGTLYGRGEMNTLVAVPINGSSPRVLVSRPNINPDFMAVDATGVYWTNRAAGVVWKAPLAGGCPTKLYSAPGTSLFHIAVDANSVYFIAIADTGRVVRLTPK